MPKAPPSFEQLENELALMWQHMEIRQSWNQAIDKRARQIIGHRQRYLEVEASTGVPWWMVGVIHSMESGLNFTRHLHNGDSLQKRTWRVPAGRPKGKPPFTWEVSADDAIRMKGWHKVSDWSMPRVLYELERYNGFGYRLYHSSVKSPYVWSGCTYYKSGKYVADGKWSATAVSGQTGCAPLLKRIFELADTIRVPVNAPDVIQLPTRKPEVEEVPEVEPVPQPAEDDDPTPVPKAGPTTAPAPVKEATRESKTILGALIALLASIVQWFDEAAKALIEAASEIATLAPAKGVLSSLGANTGSIAFGFAVFGVALVIFRRLDAAAKGKVG